MKHRTEWCAQADRYRCVRCGRGSKYMKVPGRCNGPKLLSKGLGKWERRHLGEHDLVRRMDRKGEAMGPMLVNCCRPEQMGTKAFCKMMKRIHILEEGRVPVKEAKNWRIEGGKKRITRKEYKKLPNNFEMEGLMAQQGLWNVAKEKIFKERGKPAK